jgi:hypothetical protein
VYSFDYSKRIEVNYRSILIEIYLSVFRDEEGSYYINRLYVIALLIPLIECLLDILISNR